MNEVSLNPVRIMVMYHSDTGSYIEISDIENQQVVNSRPLSKDEMKKILEATSTKKDDSTIQSLNRHIIHYRVFPLTVSWLYPENWFNIIVGNEIMLIQGIQLLLSIKDDRLYAFFVKRNTGLKTLLYNIELPNIDGQGLVCTGQYKMNFSSIEKTILTAEEAFFGTTFYEGKETKTIAEAREMKLVNRNRLKKIHKLINHIKDVPQS